MKIADIRPVLHNLSYFKYGQGERKYSRLSLEKTQYSYRFIIISEGNLKISLGETTSELCSGDVLYLLPGDMYKLIPCGSDFSLYSLFFDFCEGGREDGKRGQCVFMSGFDGELCSERIFFENSEPLNQSGVFKGLSLERRLKSLLLTDTRSERFPFYGRALIFSVIADLLFAHEKSQRSNTPSEKILEYIRLNPEADLTVEALSNLFSYHKNHINRLIKGACGKTLVEYVRDVKIDYAKTLISSGEYSLDELPSLLGYYDYSHFYKVFRASTGMTPSEYKASL